MNRIILIGNGFDLAHKMQTSYKHFIDDYWSKCLEEISRLSINKKFENDEIISVNRPNVEIPNDNYINFSKALKSHRKKLVFKNRFFEIITEKSQIENWVDIENEYYSLLKSTFNENSTSRYHNDVKTLNFEFNNVKKKLIAYLKDIELKFNKNLHSEELMTTKKIIGHKIFHPFQLKDFSESSLNNKAELEFKKIKNDIEALISNLVTIDDLSEKNKRIIQRIGTKNPLSEIKKLLQSEYAINYFDLIPDQTVFLNFNYTFTHKLYNNPKEFDQFNEEKYTYVNSINIHGTINEGDNNPIIFGYGDEIDDDYKSIEKLNNNNYLENIKSINYLETDNYKKLLEYINSGYFQVFIFGHSCGISDRTLLNTVFEHENCASVKLYYHQKEENTDNYSDIIRNISRNFNDKAKMRDRVVNKNYCEKLI